MTTRHNRREFMGLTGAGIAGLAGLPWLARSAAAQTGSPFVGSPLEPDLVVFNAKVYTVDPLEPRAQAFAVKAGKFVAGRPSSASAPRRSMPGR